MFQKICSKVSKFTIKMIDCWLIGKDDVCLFCILYLLQCQQLYGEGL